jgi:pimeloyl-ACP methyl ester carboxylesterase
VLDGVAPPGLFKGPVEFAAGAQAAMNRLVAACREDRACRAAFPEFGRKFQAIVQRLDRGPIPVRVKNVVTHRVETVYLSKEVFSDQLRHLMYDPQGSSYVPYIIERAYAGDTLPLGTVIDVVARGFAEQTDWGAFMSYTCAEEMAFITPDEIRRTSVHSWFGDVRVRAQQHACAIWNVQPVPRAFIEPVRSDAPVLMVSGTDDPATPPQFAAQELRYLPNGRSVLVRGAAHATETACTDRLKIAFVRAGSAKELDTASCNASFARPPFATSMKGFPG